MGTGLIRWLVTVAAFSVLMGCSPQFDWRTVSVADGVITGVLPAKPQSETRELVFRGQPLSLTMTMAQAGSVLFALGHAPLPAALQADPAARHALASEVIRSFYDKLGVPPPKDLPQPGQRFVIEGGPDGQLLRLEALVVVHSRGLMEAIVTGAEPQWSQAPRQDFWQALKMTSPEH